MFKEGHTNFENNFFYYHSDKYGGNIEKTIDKLEKKKAKQMIWLPMRE